MAIKHTFKATSAIMSVGGFRFSGKFVLNGNVNADGSLEIVPSNNPGEDKAFYTGDLTRPEIKIQSNSVGFDGLSQRLRAAHTVEITFTSNSDLGVSPSLTGVSIFSFSIRRNFT